MKKLEGNPHLRSAVMEVVENQLRNNDPPRARETFKRLIETGYSEEGRHDRLPALAGKVAGTFLMRIGKRGIG